jgi:hypothetical protein
VIEDLHDLARKPAHRESLVALHKQDNVVGLDLIFNEGGDIAHDSNLGSGIFVSFKHALARCQGGA